MTPATATASRTRVLPDYAPIPKSSLGPALNLVDNVKAAITTVDFAPYLQKYGDNAWAAVKHYLDEITDLAAAPVIAKYTGLLAAADVYTVSTTSWLMESLRLDLGLASWVHP